MIRPISAALISVVFFSCSKKANLSPFTAPKDEGFQLVWKDTLVENYKGSYIMSSFGFHGNKVVFTEIEDGSIVSFDQADGANSKRILKGAFHLLSGKESFVRRGEIIYGAMKFDKIQRVDLNTEVLTNIYVSDDRVGGHITLTGNDLYFSEFTRIKDQSSLFRIDIDTKQLDTIMTIQYDDWEGLFYNPTVIQYQNRNLLAIQYRAAGPNPTDSRQDYYMYDLDGDSLLWSRVHIDQEGSVSRALTYGDKVFWMGHTTVYALNVLTGNTDWAYQNPDQKGHWNGHHILLNGKYYVKNDGMLFTCFDPATGNILFQNTEAGSTPADNHVIFDGAYCFYSRGKGKFVAIDYTTGERLMYETTPVEGPEGFLMGSTIHIDPETRYLYYTNGYDVVCLKIPEW